GGLGGEVVVAVPPIGDLRELGTRAVPEGVVGQPVHRVVVEGLGAGLAAGGGDGLQAAGRVVAVGEGAAGDRVGGGREPVGVVPGEGCGACGVDALGGVAERVVAVGGLLVAALGDCQGQVAVVVVHGQGADCGGAACQVVPDGALGGCGAASGAFLVSEAVEVVERAVDTYPTRLDGSYRVADSVIEVGPGAVGQVGVGGSGRFGDGFGQTEAVVAGPGGVAAAVGQPGAGTGGVVAEVSGDRLAG